MKYSIALLSLFISASIFAFDSYKSFPIEKMQSFTRLIPSEQLSFLQSLNIDLYSFPPSKNSINNKSHFEIMSQIHEVPQDFLQTISKHNASLINSFNSYSTDNIGVFFSSSEFSPVNNTIVLGANANPFTFYHEVGHAFLELEKVKEKKLIKNNRDKDDEFYNQLRMKFITNDKININTLTVFPLYLNWSISKTKNMAEEAVINYYLLNFLDLKQFRDEDIEGGVEYLSSTCIDMLIALNFEVNNYTTLSSKYLNRIKSDSKLKLAMKQSKVLFSDFISFIDQVCILPKENEDLKRYISSNQLYFNMKKELLSKLEK